MGLAFALREAVRAIAKVVFPGGGSVVSASVAFSGTMAIGAAARAYYIGGLSLGEARRAVRRGKVDGPRDPDAPPAAPAGEEDPAKPGSEP